MLNPGKYQHQQCQYKLNLNTPSTCTGLLSFSSVHRFNQIWFSPESLESKQGIHSISNLQPPCLSPKSEPGWQYYHSNNGHIPATATYGSGFLFFAGFHTAQIETQAFPPLQIFIQSSPFSVKKKKKSLAIANNHFEKVAQGEPERLRHHERT